MWSTITTYKSLERLKARLQSRCQVQSQLTKALKARLQSRCEVHASHNVQKPPMTFSCHKSGRCLNHTWKTSKFPVSPWKAIQQTVHYPDTPFPLVHCCTLSLISSGELLNTFPIDLESHSRYAIFHWIVWYAPHSFLPRLANMRQEYPAPSLRVRWSILEVK